MKIMESVLYIDPQQIGSLPCPVCGGAVYPPSYLCIRCERDRP